MNKPKTIMIRAEELSPQQVQSIALLVGGASVQDTADAVGVSRHTLWDWRTKNEAYVEALNQAKNEIVEGVMTKLLNSSMEAVDAMTEILQSPDSSDAVKVQAAQLILSKVLTTRTSLDLNTNHVADSAKNKERMDRLLEQWEKSVSEAFIIEGEVETDGT